MKRGGFGGFGALLISRASRAPFGVDAGARGWSAAAPVRVRVARVVAAADGAVVVVVVRVVRVVVVVVRGGGHHPAHGDVVVVPPELEVFPDHVEVPGEDIPGRLRGLGEAERFRGRRRRRRHRDAGRPGFRLGGGGGVRAAGFGARPLPPRPARRPLSEGVAGDEDAFGETIASPPLASPPSRPSPLASLARVSGDRSLVGEDPRRGSDPRRLSARTLSAPAPSSEGSIVAPPRDPRPRTSAARTAETAANPPAATTPDSHSRRARTDPGRGSSSPRVPRESSRGNRSANRRKTRSSRHRPPRATTPNRRRRRWDSRGRTRRRPRRGSGLARASGTSPRSPPPPP